MSGGRYHDHIPTEILDRTYLRMLSDANDFEDDGNGLIVSTGSMGKLSAISEALFSFDLRHQESLPKQTISPR